jgi:hypothetical protein
VKKLADELWGEAGDAAGEHRLGQGRVIWGRTAREVLLADGVRLDFRFNEEPDKPLDHLRRRDGDAGIYFRGETDQLRHLGVVLFPG